ncbi:MAG: hypothetical protein ACK4NY_24475 [Spirosomataceae bacterium]
MLKQTATYKNGVWKYDGNKVKHYSIQEKRRHSSWHTRERIMEANRRKIY